MWLVSLAVLSGVSFSLIGVSYRLGQSRGISSLRIGFGLALGGAVFFGVRAWGISLCDVPGRVIVFAIIAGSMQYVVVRLVQLALSMGPLSPLWCSIALSFVPTVMYSALFLGEHLRTLQFAGVAAGILCVLVGSLQHRHSRGEEKQTGSTLLYALVLFVLFVFNCTSSVMLKDLSVRTTAAGANCISEYCGIYLAVFYAAMCLPVFIHLCVARREQVSAVRWAGLSVLAAAGSVGGMSALTAVVTLPAAMVFTVNGISSILAGSLTSVFFFRERITLAWFAMLLLGVAAAVLVNV